MAKMFTLIPQMFLAVGASLLVFNLAAPPTFAQLDLKLKNLGVEIDLPHGEGGDSAPERIGGFVIAVINLLLSFSAIIAVGAIIWGGVKITLAAGNEHNAEQGKKIILYAIIGLIITGLSFFIIALIRQTLLK